MTQFSTIGRPRKIIEGRAKVTGATRYATDLTMPGMLHARLVTSPYAHATINHIDIETAMDAPGVVAVLTAADMPDLPPHNRARLLLARGRAMFVGQPVALVLAETEAAAQDGSELVIVDYDPHPAAITIDEALAESAPLVWPDGPPGDSEEAAAHGAEVTDAARNGQKPSNVVDQMEMGRGDVDAGFAAADVIVEKTITTPRAPQNYLEPHATLVQIDPFTGGAKVWTSTQAPFVVREQVAAALQIPESDVEVVATPVGGAFGAKFLLYQPLVALAAEAAGRPVRLVLNRLEE
ncbi:MAG: molybdopterin cofactor-binding domain-containing protein, partial [Anaerolineae bacterium]|nr:molybdopterin cofactor-binding domain-containing protein [Anaerolineae bacterium]